MANSDSLKRNKKKKDGRGGARPGAGRKPGVLEGHTFAAKKARARFMQRVAEQSDKLFDAQLTEALGTSHLFRKVKERNEDGKVIKTYIEEVTDKRSIEAYLEGEFAGGDTVNDGDNYYYITTKSPNNSAIMSMLDRGLGKVADKLDADITSDGERINGITDGQFAQLVRARSNRGTV